MQTNDNPPGTRLIIPSSTPRVRSLTPTDNSSSGWVTTSSSWTSVRGMSAAGGGPDRPKLAWAGVRHQVGGEERAGVELDTDRGAVVTHCSQAVLITCLHLSHEMALREVGQYGWTTPVGKDPMGSMMKIMKKYSSQVKALGRHSDMNCRSAPDPNKVVIQHHLQRARMAAGPNSYVAVVYNGHGIQEPPTEAGELWCYDRSFDDCLQNGGGPSEYIPILLFDLFAWSGASTCYVWDCQHAGRFIRAAPTEAAEIDSQLSAAAAQNPADAELHPPIYARRQIHFAACGADQSLPRVQGMPDDLFTACLTTPLRIALLFHNLQTFPLTKGDGERYLRKSNAYMDALWENMSQSLKDRLWNELTAILHTIAWQTLDGREYQKLFGKSGDVVNNLASGFLLSQRVLGAYRTTPESIPAIPSSTNHALWTTWDLILDDLFEQLPNYFDDAGGALTKWEKDLKLVSFMADQLESITTAGQSLLFTEIPRSGMTPGLTRLPIICGAAMTSKFRVQACTALDACLKVLDVRGLARAVQGGALDVAAKLLALGDDRIKRQMISIWSSLVRADACVLALAREGLTADRLTSVPAVQFFLNALEELLEQDDRMPSPGSGSPDDANGDHARGLGVAPTVQTAAVLATIANFVAGRSAPRFVHRTLVLSSTMLCSPTDLVRQWGALLVAEVLGSLDKPADTRITESIKGELLRMVESGSVEIRAAGVYALTRWVGDSSTGMDGWSNKEWGETLGLVDALVRHSKSEGSPLVRRELARFFIRMLQSGGGLTALSLFTHILQQAIKSLPQCRERVASTLKELGAAAGVTTQDTARAKTIKSIFGSVCVFRIDPDLVVVRLVSEPLKEMVLMLGGATASPVDTEPEKMGDAKMWELIFGATFPSAAGGDETIWSEEMVDVVLGSRDRIRRLWTTKTGAVDKGKSKAGKKGHNKEGPQIKKLNNDLFERTKVALQAYLAQYGRLPEPPSPADKVAPSQIPNTRESTWTHRHRVLEDSLVVAEQQVGLPWKWAMKDISAPDPWTTITCHSFHSTVLSCNKGHDLLLWDWASSRKTGHVHLNLPPRAAITSARFVNELHEQTIILAEITNGDIHILAGPGEPSRMKSIASFRALEMREGKSGIVVEDEDQERLVTTWYRGTGRLCVGGASGVVNVWDCPAERCVQVLDTEASVPLTTIITEPVTGNIIISGFVDGMMKLFDLRQSQSTPLLSWRGDAPASIVKPNELVGLGSRRGISKVGVGLGDRKHVTEACANGLINVHDLRRLSQPASCLLAHPSGIASASFQPHSGLMSTMSVLNRPPPLASTRPAASQNTDVEVQVPAHKTQSKIASALSHLSLRKPPSPTFSSASTNTSNPPSPNASPRLTSVIPTPPRPSPTASWALHRAALGSLSEVTTELINFGPQVRDVEAGDFRPYTVMHPLRPFLGMGYGRTCYLRGCGVGKGDDTDSGSYSFLRAQANLAT
ncbi:hypothetical protein IAT38_002847 [Cryptococcus sp. DSM 104549]